MDFKEDFEFKPLSEGLGFHPRKEKKPTQPAPDMMDFEAVTPTAPKKSNEKANNGVYFLDLDETPTANDLYTPPAKKSFSEVPVAAEMPLTPSTANSATALKKNVDPKKTVDDILNSMKSRNQSLDTKLDMKAKSTNAPPAVTRTQKTQVGTATPQKVTAPYGLTQTAPQLAKTEMSFTAAFLDGLLIIASCLLCLMVLLSVTQSDLISLMTQSGQGEIYFSTFLLFSVVTLIYLTATRVFIGATPGEWAFDQQAGTDEEHQQAGYILRVLFRSVLVIATGFVVFPIISFAMAKDVLGGITGLQLYVRK